MVSFFFMEIIKTSVSQQNIKIIPRELLTSVRFILVDKEQETNIIDEIVTTSIDGEFIIVPFSSNFFKEGRRYFITILNNENKRIWLGEAFCTDSNDLQNYKINE